jgi:hypothetical protein
MPELRAESGWVPPALTLGVGIRNVPNALQLAGPQVLEPFCDQRLDRLCAALIVPVQGRLLRINVAFGQASSTS